MSLFSTITSLQMKDKYWKMQGVGDAGTVLQLWKNQMDHFNGSQNKIQEEEKKIAKHTSEMLFSRIFEHCFKNFVLNRKLSVLAIFGFCLGFFSIPLKQEEQPHLPRCQRKTCESSGCGENSAVSSGVPATHWIRSHKPEEMLQCWPLL